MEKVDSEPLHKHHTFALVAYYVYAIIIVGKEYHTSYTGEVLTSSASAVSCNNILTMVGMTPCPYPNLCSSWANPVPVRIAQYQKF